MNSNSQPTPGQWEMSKCGTLIATIDDPRVHIAQIVETGVCAPTPRESQANARLIAAAPALLAACKAALVALEYPDSDKAVNSALKQCQQAIALAQRGK